MHLLFISFEETFFIILIALLIFGPDQIPHIARELGEGIRYLRKTTNEIKDNLWEIEQYKNEKKK